MANLLYFQPDPNIADSDVLGYGDAFYDDGQSRYVSDDPDLVMGVPPPPQDMGQQGSLGMGPPMPPPIIDSEQGPLELDQLGNLRPYEGVQDPNTGELMDPGPTSNLLPALGREIGNAAQGYPEPLGQAWEQEMGGDQQAPSQGGAQAVTYNDQKTGQPMTIQPDGTLAQGAGGIPIEQLQQQMGGMQPVQREGALPPDVAQRQAQEMGAMNADTLQVEGQQRAEESRIMNEHTLRQMSANEAERHKREQELADNEARAERLRQQHQTVNDMQIDQSIIGARGAVGGIFGVLGAMLMGAAGNNQGWRMLEKDVDRWVGDQVQRKGTKLNMLAKELGNTEQAVAAGKAALWSVAAQRADLLTQKTKNDVFEAQTPGVLQKVEQLQLAEMQKFERLSLGTTLEKTPLPAKPPSAELMQKYGELRRTRQTDSGIGQRAETELGLVWDPKTQDFINKKQVLADGIQGIGALEQWVPNAVYSTLGGKTAEGYQVRGAAEAMAFAQLKQMQPTGIPTQKDIEGAVRAGAYNTEEGFIEALRRMRIATDQQKQHDAAEFGADVVTEYDRRYQASGGRTQTSSPSASRAPVSSELGAEIDRRKAPQQEPTSRGPGNLPPPTPEELQQSIRGFAESANLNPDAVARVIGHESGGKPDVVNKLTSKHAGLIQFSKETWAGLAKEAGTPDITWDDMRKMSAEEQLPYVMQYFERIGLGPDNDAGDYAMAAFMPAFWQAPDDKVLGRKGSRESIGGLNMGKVWSQNPGLRNGDTITVGDVRRSVS